MASHSECSSSSSLGLPSDEPSLPAMEPSSSPPMTCSPTVPSIEYHGPLSISTASLDTLDSDSTAEPSSSPPMPSSPIIAPSSPIESSSPVCHQERQPSQRTLILGATGNQGRGCLRALLASKHWNEYTIGVLVKDAESASAAALSQALAPSQDLLLSETLSSLGIHLLQADYSSPESLASALEAFAPTTIFFPPILSDDFQRDLVWSQNVISAARSCPSVIKIIVSTALGVDRRAEFPGWGKNGEWHPMSSYWNMKAKIEEMVKEAEFESWTILRPAWFLHSLTQRMIGWSYLGWKDTDEVRTIRTKWKRGTKVAWVDAEDVGMVAASIVDDEMTKGGKKKWRHRGVALAVEAISVGELAERMGKVLGEEVRVRYADEPSTWDAEEEPDWETGRTVSDMYPVAISQRWANEFDSSYGVEVTRELGLLGRLMTVDEFLDGNRELI